MATIRNTLMLYDSMSSSLRRAYSSVNMLLGGFEKMKDSVGEAFPESEFASARAQIQQAEAALTGMNEKLNSSKTAINSSERAQQSFNSSMRAGTSEAGSLLSKVKSVAAAYLGIQTVGAGISATDAFTNQSARLALINDGSQTQLELQRKIYAAAQDSRGAYGDMVSSVAKLGLLAKDAFSSNDETLRFAQLMNKSFKVSGSSSEEATSGMYQLTQAMAAGKLQGDEFRSVMENAPMLAQAIATYTGKTMGELKEMSSEGTITADIIKNALFAAGDDIEAKFETLPKTFSDVWTSIKNDAVSKFATIMTKVNGFINSSNGAKVISGIESSIGTLALVIGGVLTLLMGVSSFFANNWGFIAPIVWGIVAAMLAYNAVMFVSNTVQAVQNGLKALAAIQAVAHGAAITAEMAATAGMTSAQLGLNAAIYACPLTWILIAIIAIIAVIFIVIAAINKVTGSSISAVGVIAGAFLWLGALILNTGIGLINSLLQVVWLFVEPFLGIVEFMLNAANGGFDSFGDGVKNLLGQIISWFLSLGKVVTRIIDAIFGTNWTAGLTSLQDSVLGWGKNDNAITISREAPAINTRIDMSDAYSTGYNWGSNLQSSFSTDGLFGSDISAIQDSLSNIDGSTASTADSASSIADSVDISEEDLKTMRELAEMQSIQNFVSLTPTVQVTTGDLNNNADVDTLVAKIERKLNVEIAASSAEAWGVA